MSVFETISEYLGIAVFLIGAVASVGWIFGIPELKSLHPSLVSMKTNTALCFMLSGLSIWLFQSKRAGTHNFLPARLAALPVLVIGLLTLSEYLFHLDIGIDQILLREVSGTFLTAFPNRMSPLTALNFIVVGCSLLLTDKATWKGLYPGQVLILFEGLISLFAVTDYIFGASILYSAAGDFTVIALSTAITFIMIFIAILFARPRVGFMELISNDRFSGFMARPIILVSIFVPITIDMIADLSQRERWFYGEYAASLHVICIILLFMFLGLKLCRSLDEMDADRITAEEALHEAHNELEIKVEERTAELALANERLRMELEERMRAEAAVARADLQWEDTFNTISEIIFIHDREGRIIRANKAYEKITGLLNEQLAGRPYYEIFPLCDVTGENCIETNENNVTREVVADSPGKLFNATVYTHKDGEGNYLYSVYVMRDITERRQAEDVLRQYNAMLERQVEERTAEANNARLLAEAANRAKSEFLTNMSHELRTPLNAVIGFSETMLDGLGGPLTDKQAEYLGCILESGEHLHNLINDILDLSKIEAGRTDLEFNEFRVKDLIDGCLFLFREKALRHGVEISGVVEPGLENISADISKIKQVIVNLLSNAIKFTSEGGVVRVAAALSEDGETVTFSVSDTGIGISPEAQTGLFQPFKQLDSTYTKKFKGTGIGLSLCRKIVELHGGRIWVESDEGKGSRFVFTIPVSMSGR